MYHAHRYSRSAWAGEPEIDPTMDYEEREQIEGWEMTPYECLDLAYGGVLREKYVQAGEYFLGLLLRDTDSYEVASHLRFKYSVHFESKCLLRCVTVR